MVVVMPTLLLRQEAQVGTQLDGRRQESPRQRTHGPGRQLGPTDLGSSSWVRPACCAWRTLRS